MACSKIIKMTPVRITVLNTLLLTVCNYFERYLKATEYAWFRNGLPEKYGYPAILALRAMKRQIQLPSLPWICLVPRLVYPTLILNIQSANISFPLGCKLERLERCGHEQASFCQASPGRLAVLLQAVLEGWSCLVSCPHRSYTFDSFIYREERSSTFVFSTVSVFWQFATFWWSAIILLEKGKIYLVEEMWWNHLDSTPH